MIARHQETADLLVEEQGHAHLDVKDIYDPASSTSPRTR